MKNHLNQLLTINTVKISAAIATGIILAGCGNSYVRSPGLQIQSQTDIEPDPFGIIQKIIELGEQSSQIIDDLDRDRPRTIEPISLQELLKYLPEPPRKWTAQKPKGQTNSFGKYSVAQVKQTYSYQDKQMTVSIFDWAFNSALYVPFLLTTEYSQESTEGYNKGIKIDNVPGREAYNYDTKDGSLNLLIERRFFIQIEGNNIEESELREWWEMLDRDALEGW